MTIESRDSSILLTGESLSISAATEYVRDERAGAIDVFVGTTRRFTSGRETVLLEYEAFDEMALQEMARLVGEAFARWDLVRVALHHRTGRVGAAEPSVVIAVSSPHRSAAFEACRFLIERLKADVPIWKLERFADGSEEWVRPMG